MTPVYVNHDHPKVQNTMRAVAIIRRLRDMCERESWNLPRKPERDRAGKGKMALINAEIHLSELIGADPSCWRP